jgi:5-methylcytosine-specific restriction endonuclease McrA
MSFMDRVGFEGEPLPPQPLTHAVREAILQAWHGVCAYCEKSAAAHVDHIVPRAKGGPDRLDNYAAACARCNLMKSDTELPDGLVAIMIGKARRKAPKIEARLAPKRRVDRSREQHELCHQLVAWRVSEAIEIEGRSVPKARLEVAIGDEVARTLGTASVTSVRRELSAVRGRVTEYRKKRALEDEIAILIERRREGASCPTVALLLTEQERSRGGLGTIQKVRSRLKALEAPRRRRIEEDGVDLAMPQEVRRAMIQKIEACGGTDHPECIEFTAAAEPIIEHYLRTSLRRPTAWIRGCTMNLIPSSYHCFRTGNGTFDIHGPLLQALYRAEALGSEAFSFKNTFYLPGIPPVSHCRPGHHLARPSGIRKS